MPEFQLPSKRSRPGRSFFHAMPTFSRFTGGKKQAVLLSPVLPAWDAGAYFDPLIGYLAERGYDVTVFDTLSLLTSSDMPFDELTDRWRDCLQRFGDIDLLGGAALGGSVVQGLLGEEGIADIPDILLISSPTKADARLDGHLLDMARLAREESATATLKLLAHLIAADTEALRTMDDEAYLSLEGPAARLRLACGFSVLAGLDVAGEVAGFTGRLLHLYGMNSRLVRKDNIVVGDRPNHQAVGFAGCGMRPLGDFRERSLQEIARHLDLDECREMQPAT